MGMHFRHRYGPSWRWIGQQASVEWDGLWLGMWGYRN
jgi:hypothetical protein